VSILYLYSYLKDNPHLSHFIDKKDMGYVIPHPSNAVNISHQTNAGLNTNKGFDHSTQNHVQ